MRRSKMRELAPPEHARSYEEFCELALSTQSECRGGSMSGWNILAIVAQAPPSLLAITFVYSITEPGTAAWWQWFWAVVFTALALWIWSFPMRAGFYGNKRYREVERLRKVWTERLNRGQVPRWESEVDDFVPPPGTPPWPNPTAGSTAVAEWTRAQAGPVRPRSKWRWAGGCLFWGLVVVGLLIVALLTGLDLEPANENASLAPTGSQPAVHAWSQSGRAVVLNWNGGTTDVAPGIFQVAGRAATGQSMGTTATEVGIRFVKFHVDGASLVTTGVTGYRSRHHAR